MQTSLTASLTVIQTSIISLSQEIVRTQAELTLLTGVSLNLSSLEILTISITTGSISSTSASVTVTTPTTQTEKVGSRSLDILYLLCVLLNVLMQEAALTKTKNLMVNIAKVVKVVESVKAGSLTSGSEETSVTDIITALITFVTKVTVELFDDTEYNSALTLITSVTKVSFEILNKLLNWSIIIIIIQVTATLTTEQTEIMTKIGELLTIEMNC